jgi:hypothetical protein
MRMQDRSVTDIGLVFDPKQAGPKRDLWLLQERNNFIICVKKFIQTYLKMDLSKPISILKKAPAIDFN